MTATQAVTAGKPKDDDRLAPMKCMTPKARLSYPKLFKAEAFNGQDAKFSTVLLIPKLPKEGMNPLVNAMNNAGKEKLGADKTKWPQGLARPFNDGDTKQDKEGYAGHWFINVKAKNKPVVLGPDKEVLEEGSPLVYPGCYARASLLAYTYEYMGKKGFGFYLRGVQILRERGKPLSSAANVEKEFTVVDELEGGEDDGLGADAGLDDGLG